jgi:ankyrin repeat protein
VGTDNKKAVEMLIEAGADLNKLESESTRYTIMHTAAFRCKDIDIINMLIENKCSLNDLCVNEHPPITYATLLRRVDVIKLLVDAGADMNACLSAEDGGTNTPPLYYASEIGSLDVVEYMVEKGGADVHWKNKFGDTPAMWVANTKEHTDALDILKYYANRGMDMNVVNTGGYTMMHKAASRGTMDTVRYLVEEHKVDIVSATQDRNLPLHYAANCHSLDIVSYIVENGGDAQLSVENADGHTALWMAENGVVRHSENAKDDVVEYLESKIESDKCEKAEGADSGEVELEIEERA